MTNAERCERCNGPLTERWRCGNGTTNTIHFSGALPAIFFAGGGGGGCWPPPAESEQHVFCSQACQQAWMREHGWTEEARRL